MKELRVVFKMQDGSTFYNKFPDVSKRQEFLSWVAGGWARWIRSDEGTHLNVNHIVWMQPVDAHGD